MELYNDEEGYVTNTAEDNKVVHNEALDRNQCINQEELK
jgi:hypothetical protein